MGDWTTTAASWVLTYLVQSTVLLLAAALLAKWMTSPAARERLWKWALVAAVPTSLLTTWWAGVDGLRWDVSPQLVWSTPTAAVELSEVDPAVTVDETTADAATPDGAEAAAGPALAGDEPLGDELPPMLTAATARPERAADEAGFSWPIVFVGALAAGASVLLIRRGLAWRRLMSRLADREPVTGGSLLPMLDRLARDGALDRIVYLSVHDSLPTPVVLSTREVCLPRRAVDELSDSALEAVLAHELAHIRRRDTVWLWICSLLETFLFVQPLNRFGRRALLDATEQLCDDWATQHTGRPFDLAEGLAAVAAWAPERSEGIPRPCLGEDREPLLRRVERLLSPGESVGRATTRLATGSMVVLAVLACAGPGVRVGVADVGVGSVDDRSTAELVELSGQVSVLVGQRLLALPDGMREAHAELLAMPDTGAARLLERGRFNLSPLRGGGCYYSFLLDENDYDRWPDIELQQGRLSSGFHGGQSGFVLDVGEARDLAAMHAGQAPEGLDDHQRAAFAVLTDPLEHTHAGMQVLWARMQPICEASEQSVAWNPPAQVGHTYLVRSLDYDEYDLLAALTVTQQDDDGISFVWRVLKRWPVEDAGEPHPAKQLDGGAPEFVRAMTVAELRAYQAELRREVESRLTAIPEFVERRHAARFSGTDRGLVRLVQRGLVEHASESQGGLAYYGFVTRSHHYQDDVDLELQGSRFSTGFAGGDTGILIDAGMRPVDGWDATPLEGLAPDDREAWEAAWSLRVDPEAGYEGYKSFRDAVGKLYDPDRIEGRRFADSVPMVPGHSYLLRSAGYDDHDIVVAFEVLDEDEYGVFLGWRLLERFH